MRTWIVFLAMIGCATPRPAYQFRGYAPKERDGIHGYTEMRLDAHTYRVTFEGRSVEEAHRGALIRAAEIARGAGGRGFVVVDADERIEAVERGRFLRRAAMAPMPTSSITINVLTAAELRAAAGAYEIGAILGEP